MASSKTKQGEYIYVPKKFKKAIDDVWCFSGYRNRQQYLENLADSLMNNKKPKNKDGKGGEFIEFPW